MILLIVKSISEHFQLAPARPVQKPTSELFRCIAPMIPSHPRFCLRGHLGLRTSQSSKCMWSERAYNAEIANLQVWNLIVCMLFAAIIKVVISNHHIAIIYVAGCILAHGARESFPARIHDPMRRCEDSQAANDVQVLWCFVVLTNLKHG